MNNKESIAVFVGLLTTSVMSLTLLMLRWTTFRSMPFEVVFVPYIAPAAVLWGFIVGAAWDRVLLGRSVKLNREPPPKRGDPPPKRGDPYRGVYRGFAKLGVLLSALSLSGCAGGYKATYVAGATAKEFVSQSHRVYSKELNERFDQCETKVEPGDLPALNECMGKGYTSDDAIAIEQALGAYVVAAEILSATLLQLEPGREDLTMRWADAFEAALDALLLFPGAEAKVAKLRALLGRMAWRSV